jgi:Helicase HerA, central domain
MTPPFAPGMRTEGPTWARAGHRYRAPLLVRQFPPEVPFGFLGRALPTTDTVDLWLEAFRVPPGQALQVLQNAKAVAEAELAAGPGDTSTSELEVERASAEELGREVARRTQELWKVGICFVAEGSSRPRVEAVRSRLSERLAKFGFRTRVPRYETEDALRPIDLSTPTARPSGYWQTLPTDGLAALFPFSDETVVQPHGVLVGLALSDASPVFLDRWAHSSHSWGIFGTTGSGKTFATALTVLRTRWMHPDLQLTVLDPLGEYGGFVQALGGSVVSLADRNAGRLNPLDPRTTGGDRREKAARVGAMMRALYPSLNDEEVAALDSAISRLYESGSEAPRFDDLHRAMLSGRPDDHRLATLLEVFRTGSLKDLNGPTTVRLGDEPVSVDFRGVTDEQLPFHLTYVLDWAYGRLRSGSGPKLLVVDEAHLLARHSATEEVLERIVRHLRHFRAGMLVLTQNPDDFLERPSGRSLLRNLYSTAFLRLPEVSRATREFFGLTSAEAEWLPKARLPKDVGYTESLWRIGELHLPLALVAATPEYDFLVGTLGQTATGSA